jgi:hypothetical protein
MPKRWHFWVKWKQPWGLMASCARKWRLVLAAYKQAVEEMGNLIEKGRRIEKFRGVQA